MRKIKSAYKKRLFIYSVILVLVVLVPILIIVKSQTKTVTQKITQVTDLTAECDARTIACDSQFQENKNAACGPFKSLAVDNLISRDESPCKGMDRSFVEKELDKACFQGCVQATATLTPANIPNATAVPTNSPTTFITKIPTSGLSAVPTSPTSIHEETIIQVKFKYPGIGSGLSENTNPKTPSRGFAISLYKNSQSSAPVYSVSTTTFDGNLFTGEVAVSEEGDYLVRLSSLNTLESKVPFTVKRGERNVLPQVVLTPGYLDKNYILDIHDFNILVSCYEGKICDSEKLADLNDDGLVDSKDLNILLRSFALRNN